MKSIISIIVILGGLLSSAQAQQPIKRWINPTGEATGSFGQSMDVSPSFAIIGDPNATGTSQQQTGAAFIYDLKAPGSKPIAILQPSDLKKNDDFGIAVAITDTFAFVGAQNADYADSTDLGSVYVYKYQNGQWGYDSKILVPDTLSSGMHFGATLSVDHHNLIVGSPGAPDFSGVREIGMAFMYTLKNGKWKYVSNLFRSLPVEREHYGYSVGVSDTIAVIGMKGYGLSPKPDEAHVFIENPKNDYWSNDQTLDEKNSYYNDKYASAVAAYGNRVLVGAYADEYPGDSYGTYGLVYVYKDQNGTWIREDTLGPSKPQEFEKFGEALTIYKKTIAVGAPDKDLNGAVYIYNFDHNKWKQTDYIPHPDPPTNPNDYSFFGSVISMNDKYMLISDPTHANSNGDVAGTVFVYNSQSVITSVDKNLVNQPDHIQLMKAYPNPFNPSTIIRYKLDEAGMVQIDIYNSIGRHVSTLIDKKQSAGQHIISWQPKNLSSGVYFIRLRMRNHLLTQPVTYFK